MNDFSKDDLNTIMTALIKLKDQSETEGFIEEKRIIDSYSDSSKVVQLFYDQLLNKIKDAIKRSDDSR